MRKYSMAYLTANGADPVTAVEVAAKAGYDMISFRFLPAGPGDVPPPLMENDALLADTIAAMQTHGVEMADAEMIRLAADTDPAGFKPFLDRITKLRAKHILVAVDDPVRPRAIETYARLCEQVEPYGVSADLEFMPWTGCKSLRDALEFMDGTTSPAAAILLDTLHFDRSGSALADIDAIPAECINYVQLCDGPADYDASDEGLIRLARNVRLIPGRGDIDLAPIIARLPADVTVSVEVPDKPLATQMGLEQFARAALEETKALTEPQTR